MVCMRDWRRRKKKIETEAETERQTTEGKGKAPGRPEEVSGCPALLCFRPLRQGLSLNLMLCCQPSSYPCSLNI